jgi:hypothetical protein
MPIFSCERAWRVPGASRQRCLSVPEITLNSKAADRVAHQHLVMACICERASKTEKTVSPADVARQLSVARPDRRDRDIDRVGKAAAGAGAVVLVFELDLTALAERTKSSDRYG